MLNLPDHPDAPNENPRRASAVLSSLPLFILILFLMGAVLSNVEGEPLSSQAPPAPITSTTAALLPATPPPAQTHTLAVPPTFTAKATELPTSTATASATATKPPTPFPTATMTQAPAQVVPPTDTPLPPPLPTPQGVFSWTLKVPILMYHYISVPPEDADVYRVDLSVEPDVFREQMAYLASNGYTAVDLYALSRAVTNQAPLPAKPVIITIDDGYRDNYENAFPVLREFGLTATIFVATDFLDQNNPNYLSWAMVEEMAAAGIRFEPHTKTHPDLRGQEREYLIWQILGSQETIAAHIGTMPRYFAYPSGYYDDDTIAILRELDFWGAVTTQSGKWHGFEGRYEWARLRVRHNTPLPEFIDLVDPGDAVGGKSP